MISAKFSSEKTHRCQGFLTGLRPPHDNTFEGCEKRPHSRHFKGSGLIHYHSGISIFSQCHATKRAIQFVPSHIRRSIFHLPFLLITILPIHKTRRLISIVHRSRHRLSICDSLRLQDLLLPIQPSRRKPALLSQLFLLQPGLPFFQALVSILLESL